MSIKSNHLAAVLMSGSILVLGGCGVGTVEDESGPDEAMNIAATEQAVISGWSPYTSEEYPPIVCDASSLATAVQCSGSYCDKMRLKCQPTAGVRGDSFWTPAISDEKENSFMNCAQAGYWLTGILCTGSYCDNVAIQCTHIQGLEHHSCTWTGWMSEEDGGQLLFAPGYYATGLQCKGDNCDSLRYYLCKP